MICSVYDERKKNWVIYETENSIESFGNEAEVNGFINLMDALPSIPIGSKILGNSEEPEGMICKPYISENEDDLENVFFWGLLVYGMRRFFLS